MRNREYIEGDTEIDNVRAIKNGHIYLFEGDK